MIKGKGIGVDALAVKRGVQGPLILVLIKPLVFITFHRPHPFYGPYTRVLRENCI